MRFKEFAIYDKKRGWSSVILTYWFDFDPHPGPPPKGEGVAAM
jgi:hypothetical protein